MATKIIPPPRKAQTLKQGDQSKHCQYHRNHFHHTEECIALKDQIEELVQVGQLKRFVRDGGIPRRGRSQEQRERGMRVKGKNILIGGMKEENEGLKEEKREIGKVLKGREAANEVWVGL